MTTYGSDRYWSTRCTGNAYSVPLDSSIAQCLIIIIIKETPWSESASELYRASDLPPLVVEVIVNFCG
jgi:hypothetical protein